MSAECKIARIFFCLFFNKLDILILISIKQLNLVCHNYFVNTYILEQFYLLRFKTYLFCHVFDPRFCPLTTKTYFCYIISVRVVE